MKKAREFLAALLSAAWLFVRCATLAGGLYLFSISAAWLWRYGYAGPAAAICYGIFVLLVIGNLPSVKRTAEGKNRGIK